MENTSPRVSSRAKSPGLIGLKTRFGQFYEKKTTEKPKMLFFLEVLQNLKDNRLCDVRNDKCTIHQ